ncbi:MAG: lysine 2,3-aminomutase [Spirochaetales bacterium]|nr:lysine 2,3-aminomutase [Spirochaetales bacterium]
MNYTLTQRVTPFFSGLALPEVDDPIRRQFMPTDSEGTVLPYESADPLHEDAYSPVSRLIHRYPSRVLALTTDECAINCRYCFRRYFTGSRSGPLSSLQLEDILNYVKVHREIDEVLLSGGDPLTLSDSAFAEMLSRFRSVRDELVLRICTRIPSVLPSRITDEFCAIIAKNAPAWIIAQFNHPREITPQCKSALRTILRHGVPVMCQTVLLKGINDNAGILAELFRALVRCHVKPYYLFQGDLAAGTSHFRVRLDRSIEIVSELKGMISRIAMPRFAVDLPDGGGKTEITETNFSKGPDGWFLIHGRDGVIGRYPAEGEPTDA